MVNGVFENHPNTVRQRAGRRNRQLLSLFLLALCLVNPELRAGDQAEAAFRVPGTVAWIDTGISVTPSDRVTITASGEVCFNEKDDSCFPPQGYPRESYVRDYFELDYAYCEDEFESFDHAALVVQIGETVLQVGRRISFSGLRGAMRLGVNDCSLEGRYGNSGSYRAFVTVEQESR